MSTTNVIIDDLDDYGFEEVEEPLPDGGAEALDKADALCRKIRRLQRDRAELQAHARAEHARIDEWLSDRTAGMDEQEKFLTGQLERFARAYKARAKKAPPKLVNGTLRLSGPRIHVEVEDEDAFIEWAKTNDHVDLVRKKETPAKDELQKVVKEGQVRTKNDEEQRMSAVIDDGEVIPGVVLVRPVDDSFSLTIT